MRTASLSFPRSTHAQPSTTSTHAMSSAGPDNANPTIHAASHAPTRRTRLADLDLQDDLDQWQLLQHHLEHGDHLPGGDHAAVDDLEDLIDQDEIFGPSAPSPPRGGAPCPPAHPADARPAQQTSSAPSRIQSTRSRSSSSPSSRPPRSRSATAPGPRSSSSSPRPSRTAPWRLSSVRRASPRLFGSASSRTRGRRADAALVRTTGLSLRVRLLRSLPERFKVDIKVKEGTHQSENAGASRACPPLAPFFSPKPDLERRTDPRCIPRSQSTSSSTIRSASQVRPPSLSAFPCARAAAHTLSRRPSAAALENSHLLSVVQQCLSTADQRITA